MIHLEELAYQRGSESQAALLFGKILWSTQGSHREGIELLRVAAEAGEAEALYVLGLACFRGQGVEKNLAAARELQLAAAMRGLPDAQFELSLLLAQGLGGEVDAEGTRRWEAKAAKAGHPRACLNRGARLANSKRPDWDKVAHWYARAAAAGNAEAAARLSKMTKLLETSENVMKGGTAEDMMSPIEGDVAQHKRHAAGEFAKRSKEAPPESELASKPVALVPEGSAAELQINAAAAPPVPKRDEEVSQRASKADVPRGHEQGKFVDKRRWKANDSRFSALLSQH
jgi:TPR repeat protein